MIEAAKAKEKVMNAERMAQTIEKEAMQEIECRNILEKAADNDSENNHNELSNTVAQNTFCTNKKICGSTGKVLNWYNVLGSNNATCANIKQKYNTFKQLSSNAAGGGKKTARKRIKRKNNSRKPKKKTRKNKKKNRKTKKKTLKPRKKTRRVKKRSN
jgi:hypothetical protein